MYLVYLNNKLFSSPNEQELIVLNPELSLEKNGVGGFTFTMPPDHPYINEVVPRKSIFRIYDTREIDESKDILVQNPKFEAFCVDVKTNLFKSVDVVCEGTLSFLNDSILRPNYYSGFTTRQLLESYINQHNSQVDDFKRFQVGAVTAVDKNEYISCYSNYNTTLTEIIDDLVESIGGYLQIRVVDNVRYIDFLSDENAPVCSQPIKLGSNLIDYNSNLSSIELATCIIPLGARKEESSIAGLEERVSLKDLPSMGGVDYVYSPSAVEQFGYIYKTITFDDVTLPENLYTKGIKYLESSQFANLIIECRAFDLSVIDSSYENFKMNQKLRIQLDSHGMNTLLPVTQILIPLWNPEQEIVTLGNTMKNSISKQSASLIGELSDIIDNITPPSSILKSAIENATALITSAMGGYVYKTNSELYIMDSDNPDLAVKVWRWNINGLGYSSNGINGPYGLAMTMDGRIVADFITTGTMSADRLHGGKLVVGGRDNDNGVIEVKDADGRVLVTLNQNGMTLADNVSISWGNISGTPTIPTQTSQLNNDSGLAYTSQIPSNTSQLNNDSGLAYSSQIPTNVSQLNNDSGYTNYSAVTQITRDTVTTSYVNALDVTAKDFKAENIYGKYIADRQEYPNFELKQDGSAVFKNVSIEGTKSKLAITADSPINIYNPTLGDSDNNKVTYGSSSIQMYSSFFEKNLMISSTGMYFFYNGQYGLTSIEPSRVTTTDLSVSGSKNRIVETKDYNTVKLHAFETPSPMFADVGEGCTDDTGTCIIFIDDIFTEVCDMDVKYQVFVQANKKGDIYVTERSKSYFRVEGDANIPFSWEIKAVQRDYDTLRFEEYEEYEEPRKEDEEANTAMELEKYVYTLHHIDEDELLSYGN